MAAVPDAVFRERDTVLRRGDLPGISAVFLCALAAVLPLIVRGNSFGHDFDFHLLSWMETAKQWHQGVVYPHWLASANYGAGEPRFVFYPPASWMLGALLGTLTNWGAAPILFIFLSLFCSGISLYYLARGWMPREAATLAACIYAVNPYAIFCAYERSAYGELLAGAWIPLILLFALRQRSSTVALALTVAAVWLTNAPAAVMACYALAVIGVAIALAERRLLPLVRIAAGCALGMGLASFYIIPAAYQRQWVQIDRAIGPGMRVQESFLFAQAGDAFHVAVLRTASTIAVVLLLSAVVALAILWSRRKPNSPARRRLLTTSSWITVAVFFLLLRWSSPIWRFAPELRFLQFPWRWLLLESVVTAVVTALAVTTVSADKALRQMLWRRLPVVAAVALMLGIESSDFYQRQDDDDTLASQFAVFNSGAGVEGTDEYTPKDTDNSAIQKNLPPLRVLSSAQSEVADSSSENNPPYSPAASKLDAQVTLDRWQAEHKVVQVATKSPGFAVFRLMDYPGWLVLVNASPQTARAHRTDGLLVVSIPAGISRIEIAWQPKRDEQWAKLATFVSLFLIVPIAWIERRRDSEDVRGGLK